MLIAQGKNPLYPEDKKEINARLKNDPNFVKNMFMFEGEDVPVGKGMLSPIDAKTMLHKYHN